MAKKNTKINIDTKNVDVKFERENGNVKLDYDSKNLDVSVEKTENGTEVKVDAEKGILKTIGKIIGRVLLRRLK